MSSDIDIGPLSWVKSEIDLALGRAAEALAEYGGARTEGKLQEAYGHLHQAHGALSIVGLSGVTEYSEALEALVRGFAAQQPPWSTTLGETARTGIGALREFLDGLMAGEPCQPMRLMAEYAALLIAAGQPAPDASALFYPDLSQRPPRRDSEPAVPVGEARQQILKSARASFERALLRWIKGDSGPDGAGALHRAVAEVEAVMQQPADRALWWAALGVCEALGEGGFAPEQHESVKKFMMRLGQQIKRVADDQFEADERTLAQALYLVGIARSEGAQVETVRAAYRVADLLPRDSGAQLALLRPQLNRMRELVGTAKEDWNRLCGGTAAALPPFHERVTELAERGRTIGSADVAHLTQALMRTGDRLRRDPALHNEAIGIEVATALLLAESGLENFRNLGSDFSSQVDTMVRRLEGALDGADLTHLSLPHLDEVAQRAQERLLMNSVAREILSNLATVEQALDAFFRDTTKNAELATLARPLLQIEGALSILGHERPVTLLREAAAVVARLAEDAGAIPAEQFQKLAHQLSGIGLFVEQLQSGVTVDIDRVLAPVSEAAISEAAGAEAKVEVEAEIVEPPQVPVKTAAIAEAPAAETVVPITSPEPAQVPAPVTEAAAESGSETVPDPELLEIFLEEAGEVLQTIRDHLPGLHINGADNAALTTVRRSFHTLKGSGRMVHLTDFGEAAWGVEQVMNAWLQENKPATSDLLRLLDHAAMVFSGWVEQLAAGGSTRYNAKRLNAATAALLAGQPLPDLASDVQTVGAPAEEIPAVAETQAPILEALAATPELQVSSPGIEVQAIAGDESDSQVPPGAQVEEPSADELALDLAALAPAPEEVAAEAKARDLIELEPEELAAELEAREAEREQARVVAELEAAELAAAEATIGAVPPAPTLGTEAASESVAQTVVSADAELLVDALEPIAELTPTAVSDEELLAAELAAAEAQAAAALASVSVAASEAPAPVEVSAEVLAAPAEVEEFTLDLSLAEIAIPEPAQPQPSEALTEPEAPAPSTLDDGGGALPVGEPAPAIEAASETAEIVEFPTPQPVRIGELEISPVLFSIFSEEAQGHLGTLLQHIGDGGAPGEAVIRAAHTLGSTSGTTGFLPIHRLARALEHTLVAFAESGSSPGEAQRLVLARAVGALEGMLGAALARRMPGDEADLAAELQALRPEVPAEHEAGLPEAAVQALHAAHAAAESVVPSMPSEFTAAVAEFALGEVAATDALAGDLVPAQPAANELSAAEPATEPVEEPGPTPEHETEFALPTSGKPLPPQAPQIVETAPERRAQRIADEIDEQLLPIFLEEAVDLMASIDTQLRSWREQPENQAFATQLKRDLHTIKGSARMAGAMGCGELFHSMESRIEQAQAMRQVGSDLFDGLDISFERGSMLIERLQRGEFGVLDLPPEEAPAAAVAEPAAVATAPAAPVAPTPAAAAPSPVAQAQSGVSTQTAAPSPARAGTQVQLRVRADLVDKLVNEAGEVAIARSRIEGEMRALKHSLLELTDNVIRLRHQLREIEIEAETQMASQITFAKEQAEQEGRAFDALEFDRFTRFQELTRMMAESVNDVGTIQQNLLVNLNHADAALIAQSRINRELSERLMGVRMVPFESQADRLHRVVRQAAKDAGKRCNLDIRGGQMGIDRSVLEHITGPLEHLLRNSVGHGIEDTPTREAHGKSPFGQITLSLAQEGNHVVLSIADDGAGLNLERIRARAIERGLLAPDEQPDERNLIGMIFQSGFSTAEKVTALSGRGVGMDVVKTEIEELGGHVEVLTAPGKGSTFRLFLPLTLAVSQAVLIYVGARRYALPASMIEQAKEMKPDAIQAVRDAGYIEHLGHRFPYYYLSRLLGQSNAQPIPARRHWLVLVKGGAERVAIEIDGMIGNQEIVLKNLGPQLARIPGFAGATVLGDGEIALILNPIALAARAARTVEATVEVNVAAELPPAAEPEAVVRTHGCVMVVDDSLTVRKITGRLLARHGFEVITAKDGVDALEQLTDVMPDVMLLDIEMPRMDGFELARNVRGDDKLRHIPIVMITSRTADKHRQYAEEIGVNHYLGKPYNEDVLLDLVKRYALKT